MELDKRHDIIQTLVSYAQNISTVEDDELPRFFALVDEIRKDNADTLGQILTTVKREMLRRMKDRDADAIPHKEFEIALDRQYTTYEYDIDKLRAAKDLLPAEEAAKVIRWVPEHTVVVPGKWEPGAPVSIKALAKKYRKTYVSDLLTEGLKRTELEPRVIVKPRKTIRTITPAPHAVRGVSA